MNTAERLKNIDVGHVSFSEPLSSHCSWRIGGPADALVQPDSEEQILRLLEFVRGEGIPLLVIGRGTNILFPDGGIRG
ncbi:MAG: UDP-N-acetylenolpyruvoylglucosamine reductase, partial [Synergistaceae bacterium]|nr:UDP-N-acetylenolpyruvoylglucosamine reductase [Synergistaceae bacterium]